MPSRVLHKASHVRWALRTRLIYVPRMRSAGRNVVFRRPMLVIGLGGVTVGSDVHVREGARIELIRRPDGPAPELIIGSNVLIEQQVHIACCQSIRIGSNVAIAARCAIVDVDHPVHDPLAPANLGNAVSGGATWVEIGDGAFLGAGVVVLPRTRIGQGAVIGANSVVTKDVPDWCIAAGAPAKVIGKRNHR